MAKKNAPKELPVINGEEAMRVYKQPMAVELTEAERLKMDEDAGNLNGKLKGLAEKLKKETEGTKGEIKIAKAKLQKLLDSMETGTQDREVECAEVGDYKRNKVVIYRMDTDPPSKYEERAMRPEERQTDDRRLTDPAPKKDKDKGD